MKTSKTIYKKNNNQKNPQKTPKKHESLSMK